MLDFGGDSSLASAAETLGVSRAEAGDAAALKAAFRRQAARWHPDRHQAQGSDARSRAETKFKAAQQAYEKLIAAVAPPRAYGSHTQYERDHRRSSSSSSSRFYNDDARFRQFHRRPRYQYSVRFSSIGRVEAAYAIGIAGAAFLAVTLSDYVFSKIFQAANRGKSFEDIIERQDRKKE